MSTGRNATLWVGVLGALALLFATPVLAQPRYHPEALFGRVGKHPVKTVVARADAGDRNFQAGLGYMYATGEGVPQDYVAAAKWYRRAAEQGHVIAQHMLGLIYNKGQGVDQDYVEAHKWLSLAASHAKKDDRDYYVRMRNAVASKLTREELSDAMLRARKWYPKPERRYRDR